MDTKAFLDIINTIMGVLKKILGAIGIDTLLGALG